MSAKIVVYAPYVSNHLKLLEQNLMLPIVKNSHPQYYYPEFEKAFELQGVLGDTQPIIYAAYFHKDGFLRHQYFDVIRAMGLKEMWVMSEMETDCFDDYDFRDGQKNIHDFLAYLEKTVEYTDHSAPIKEFDINDFAYDKKGWCINYYNVYHDTFKDCFEKVAAIERQFKVYVLGLNKFEDKYIRVFPNDGSFAVKLLIPETGEMKDWALS